MFARLRTANAVRCFAPVVPQSADELRTAALSCSHGASLVSQRAKERTSSSVTACPAAAYRNPGGPLSAKTFAATTPKGSTSGPSPSSTRATTRLEQHKSFTRDGYLVVKNLFTPAEVAALRDEITAIARGRHGEFDGYLPAGGQMTDLEAVGRYSRIEFPHKLVPALQTTVMRHPKIVEVLTNVIGPDIKAMSSKLYIDGPGARGRSWHQDESVIPTRDRSLVCAIVALDDHIAETGCLLVHPGSHKSGVLFRVSDPLSGSSANSASSSAAAASASAAAAVAGAEHLGTSPSGTAEPLTAAESALLSDPVLHPPGGVPTLASAPGVHVATASESECASCSEDDSVRDAGFDSDDAASVENGVPIELATGSVFFVNGYTLYRMLPQPPLPVAAIPVVAPAAPATATAEPGAAATDAPATAPAAAAVAAAESASVGVPVTSLRRALKVHYCSAKTLLPWWIDNQVPPTHDNRDIVMVSGVDPYAYKGITATLSKPRAVRAGPK